MRPNTSPRIPRIDTLPDLARPAARHPDLTPGHDPLGSRAGPPPVNGLKSAKPLRSPARGAWRSRASCPIDGRQASRPETRMLTDHERIARQQGDPALLRLQRALSRLKSVLTYMNTGAHPDDEHSGLLAALRFHYGMRVVVACATRGEGGQNAIGPERGAALGVLRTREMEASARVIDAGIAWLGHGPDDPLHDFGFSKSGDDTLARWGERRILERLVKAYRMERPDIVSPTFLDVPGQHGHHRAMTRAAVGAFALGGRSGRLPGAFRGGPAAVAGGEALSPRLVRRRHLLRRRRAASGRNRGRRTAAARSGDGRHLRADRRMVARLSSQPRHGNLARRGADALAAASPSLGADGDRTGAEHRGRAPPRPRGPRGATGPAGLRSRRASGSAGFRRCGHRRVPVRRCGHAHRSSGRPMDRCRA